MLCEWRGENWDITSDRSEGYRLALFFITWSTTHFIPLSPFWLFLFSFRLLIFLLRTRRTAPRFRMLAVIWSEFWPLSLSCLGFPYWRYWAGYPTIYHYIPIKPFWIGAWPHEKFVSSHLFLKRCVGSDFRPVPIFTMPLRTASYSLTRKTTKDGRKRALSTISNTTQSTQAGPADASRNNEKRSNGPNKALKSQATPESPADKPVEPIKNVPDVFQYLDNNEDSSNSSSSSSSSESESKSESSDDESPPVTKQTTPKIQSPKPRSSPTSNALLGSTTIPPKAPAPPPKTSPTSSNNSRSLAPPPAPAAPVPTRNDRQMTRKQPPSKSSVTGFYDTTDPDLSPQLNKRQLELSLPESYYAPSRDVVHRSPLPPSPPSSPEDSIVHGTSTKRRNSSVSHVSSGYGMVASHLTRSLKEEKGGFPPLYRRFGDVNHRVLLYLQDEISHMEEDLQALDEYEEMHRVANAEKEGTKPMPASRRLDVQSQAYSSLHYRRVELMAALTQKTEQYSMSRRFRQRQWQW